MKIVLANVVEELKGLSRFREGEDPAKPVAAAARQEARPPRIVQEHLATAGAEF